MQESGNNRELLSALVDGQLRGEEFARTVAWVGRHDDARLAWDSYHLVGEVLRSGEAMANARDADFVHRLTLRLKQEPPRPAEVTAIHSVASSHLGTRADGAERATALAANDSTFRWKLLAGVASMAFVSAIGWQAVSGWGEQGDVPKLAQVPALPLPQQVSPGVVLQQAMVAGEPQLMIRDAQLDALLAAHRQFGGTSALQVPTGFLRNATFDGATR